jgi:hypothetical protein
VGRFDLVVDPEGTDLVVRRADLDDVTAIGQMLYDFNREFDEPAPHPHQLAQRIRQLLGAGDTTVLLGGRGPDGLVALRFRPAIWSDALECYLAGLYVVPTRRVGVWDGHGWRQRSNTPETAALITLISARAKTMLGPHPLRESRLPQPRRGS